MKVLFLLRSLHRGGAERQALLLARRLREMGEDASIILFYDQGELRGEAGDVPLFDLGKSGRWDVAGLLWRFARLVRREQPDVIYSFLGTANLVAGLGARLAGRPGVVWGVRSANMDLSHYDRVVRLEYALQPRLAKLADAVVVNSQAGLEHLRASGFPSDRLHVVENGVDLDHFRRDPAAGEAVRAELGIPGDSMVVGMVARMDPIKDHATFLRAASEMVARDDSLRFLLVGGGDVAYENGLRALTGELGLADKVVFAGERSDLPGVYSAMDVCCLCSTSEGFPNVVVEAMACGSPCVVTRAGDMPRIVGDPSLVVQVGDAPGVARALEAAIGQLRKDGGGVRKKTRERMHGFDTETMVSKTGRLLREFCRRR
ncbi:glycosyltransferase [Desulfohalovibrio reitneri]|uniref:glycosyltransferase n=1 Tax=Desulfohalovibrio reitneri TaxID=1307759 RepID=UPI0004A6EFAC|nr:glycosyltransferase [Desulfohalovibrio reitneri]